MRCEALVCIHRRGEAPIARLRGRHRHTARPSHAQRRSAHRSNATHRIHHCQPLARACRQLIAPARSKVRQRREHNILCPSTIHCERVANRAEGIVRRAQRSHRRRDGIRPRRRVPQSRCRNHRSPAYHARSIAIHIARDSVSKRRIHRAKHSRSRSLGARRFEREES